MVTAEFTIGPSVHDLGEVPEQREREHDRRHQRERALAVVVRDADERRGSEQADQRRRLEAGTPEAFVELEGGDARRWPVMSTAVAARPSANAKRPTTASTTPVMMRVVKSSR